MKAILLIILLAILSGFDLTGEEVTVHYSGPRTVRLPFKITPDGKPFIRVTLNGSERVLFVDTGATTILDLELARSLGMDPKDSGQLGIGLTGVTGPRYVAIADFQIGRMEIKGMPVSCLDLSSMREPNRKQDLPEFDGLIGSDLLSIFRARIDYDTMTLTLKHPKKEN